MTAIQQIVEIDPDRRYLRLSRPLPETVGVGQTTIILIIPGLPVESRGDLELINQNADRLNREALDVLSYQQLDL
jgi:predicted ABC-type transport system involved in lysophospholipase L1 biosynthesis ATPase subunit